MKRRWRLFAVLSFLYLLAYFYRVSMAVLAGNLSRDLALSAVQLGTLSGAFFYAFAVTQLPLGPLLDRYGGKRIVLLTGLATICGCVLFARATTYPQALLGRILLGTGSASVLMGSLRVFTNWFDRREFGQVSGFIIAVGNIGNLAGTAPLAAAAAAIGWRTTFLAVAGIQAAALLLAQAVVSERPCNTALDGDLQAPAPESLLGGLRQVLATPSYWLLSFLAFSWYANYMAVQGLWGGPYLVDAVGLSAEGAGRMLLATSLGFLVGCLGVGTVTERLFHSPRRTLLCGQLLLLACMSLFLGPAERLPVQILAPLFFLMGIAVSSGVSIYAMIRESFPPAIIGSALTAVNFFILMGAATMQQLMGGIIGRYGKTATGYPGAAYHAAFLLPISLLALSILLFLRVRDPHPAAKANSAGL